MPMLALGLLAFATLVFVGRYARRARIGQVWAPAIGALLAAAGAVAAGLRGEWIVSLILVALSAWLGRAAGRRPVMAENGPSGAMRPSDARAILGVGAGAARAEIDAAYRRLMLRAHPDQGGSAGLAAQLNAARDCLLKKS